MTNANQQASSALRRWGITALAVAMGGLFGSVLTAAVVFVETSVDFGAVQLTAEPSATFAPCDIGITERQAELEEELAHARYAATQHLRALYNLRDDPRWEEPEQEDALAGAMRDSSQMAADYQARSVEIERTLALLH